MEKVVMVMMSGDVLEYPNVACAQLEFQPMAGMIIVPESARLYGQRIRVAGGTLNFSRNVEHSLHVYEYALQQRNCVIRSLLLA